MKYGLGYTLITRTSGFLARTIFYFRKTELNYIINFLRDKNNIRILDYGCNTAYFLNIIKNKFPSKNFDLCGTDINEYALKYAKKKYYGETKPFHPDTLWLESKIIKNKNNVNKKVYSVWYRLGKQ